MGIYYSSLSWIQLCDLLGINSNDLVIRLTSFLIAFPAIHFRELIIASMVRQ